MVGVGIAALATSLALNRCYFEIDITDYTGTITAIVTETLAEKILAMRAEQVYETVVVQGSTTKPLLRIPDKKIGALVISSYAEKGPPTFALPSEATKKQKLGPPTPTKQR